MDTVKKISDLTLGLTYVVSSYRPVTTKFGLTCILKVTESDTYNCEHEMWSTKAITKYIQANNLQPSDKFCFTVNTCDKYGVYADKIQAVI
jgi:hypothetical protein